MVCAVHDSCIGTIPTLACREHRDNVQKKFANDKAERKQKHKEERKEKKDKPKYKSVRRASSRIITFTCHYLHSQKGTFKQKKRSGFEGGAKQGGGKPNFGKK